MKIIRGLLMAWSNFSNIPCPSKKWDEDARGWMLVWMPLVGIVIGIIWSVCFVLFASFGFSGIFAGALLTVIPFGISGFMHLDGFMDLSDALMSRRPVQAERRRILKDSNVGAFGVISVVVMFIIYFGSMTEMIFDAAGLWTPTTVTFIFFMSRTMVACDVLGKAAMDGSQYSGFGGSEEGRKLQRIVIALLSVVLVIFLCLNYLPSWGSIGYGLTTVIMALIPVASAFTAGRVLSYRARVSLGGMSGDIAGATIVVTEVFGFAVLAIVTAIV